MDYNGYRYNFKCLPKPAEPAVKPGDPTKKDDDDDDKKDDKDDTHTVAPASATDP